MSRTASSFNMGLVHWCPLVTVTTWSQWLPFMFSIRVLLPVGFGHHFLEGLDFPSHEVGPALGDVFAVQFPGAVRARVEKWKP